MDNNWSFYVVNLINVFVHWFIAIVQTFLPFLKPKKSVKDEIILITGAGSGIGQLMAIEFAKLGNFVTNKLLLKKIFNCLQLFDNLNFSIIFLFDELTNKPHSLLGATIVAWDINDASLAKTKKLVEQAGSKCFTYNVDVTDRAKVYETASLVKLDVGMVYMLINNAGIVIGEHCFREILRCFQVILSYEETETKCLTNIGKDLLQLEDEEILATMNVNAISHFWTIKAFLPDMILRDNGHIVTIASLAGKVGVNKLTDYCASKVSAVIGLQNFGHSNSSFK